MKKDIIIIGYGYVGKAMAELMNNRNDLYNIHIYTLDYNPTQKENELYTFVEKLNSKHYDLAILSVPTPMKENGECDISSVESSIKNSDADIYLIKSTVEIGTTDYLKEKYNKRIVFSPEYVGESKYFNEYFPNNMIEEPMFTVGGDSKDTQKILEYFVPILGVKNYTQVNAKEAEMMKYMENSFYATKITFCNEIYEMCEKLDIDYYKVRQGWLADPRIHPMHTLVFKENRGFAGKCLPKDTNALIKLAEKIGVEATLLKGVVKANNFFQSKNKK